MLASVNTLISDDLQYLQISNFWFPLGGYD